MITKDGVAKLADMGLARETTDMEAAQGEAGRAYGTPYYISPEQIRGELDIDFRADIYSLGATFYHMVTGKVPFEGTTPSAVMHKHLKEPLVPPDHINHEPVGRRRRGHRGHDGQEPRGPLQQREDLLMDLEAVRQGDPPLQAHKRFDVSVLEQLEEGDTVEAEQPEDTEEIITRYRLYLLILGAVSTVVGPGDHPCRPLRIAGSRFHLFSQREFHVDLTRVACYDGTIESEGKNGRERRTVHESEGDQAGSCHPEGHVGGH